MDSSQPIRIDQICQKGSSVTPFGNKVTWEPPSAGCEEYMLIVIVLGYPVPSCTLLCHSLLCLIMLFSTVAAIPYPAIHVREASTSLSATCTFIGVIVVFSY